jgi:hypothetical protein
MKKSDAAVGVVALEDVVLELVPHALCKLLQARAVEPWMRERLRWRETLSSINFQATFDKVLC